MPRLSRIAVYSLFVICLGFLWMIGSHLIAPARSIVGAAPLDLGAENVQFQSGTGLPLAGWFIRGNPGTGAVLILHGIHSNRVLGVPRARFLKSLGYSVLLIDMQAHGESAGDHMTFGQNEARDAEAALTFLSTKVPGEKLAAIGISLGGAALLLAHQPLKLDALVLESVYRDIDSAVENRFPAKFGVLKKVAKYLLLWQLPLRLGISVDSLRPIDHIGEVDAPILIMSGTEDTHTLISESRELCAKAVEPKECWWVDGAEHIDLHSYARAQYEEHLAAFLKRSFLPG